MLASQVSWSEVALETIEVVILQRLINMPLQYDDTVQKLANFRWKFCDLATRDRALFNDPTITWPSPSVERAAF
jgi:hypothetical protein